MCFYVCCFYVVVFSCLPLFLGFAARARARVGSLLSLRSGTRASSGSRLREASSQRVRVLLPNTEPMTATPRASSTPRGETPNSPPPRAQSRTLLFRRASIPLREVSLSEGMQRVWKKQISGLSSASIVSNGGVGPPRRVSVAPLVAAPLVVQLVLHLCIYIYREREREIDR